MKTEFLSLKQIALDCERFGSANKVAQAAGVPASTITRLLNAEHSPRWDTLVRLARAVGVHVASWIETIPVDWQRLDISAPRSYDTFVDEMMNSTRITGFGKNLHCYLLPREFLLGIHRAESASARLPSAIAHQREQEEMQLIDQLHENCKNRYRFECYRALGVASSLLAHVSNHQNAIDRIVDNLRDDRQRGVFGLVHEEVFNEAEHKLQEITGFTRFTSLTILDHFRAIVWTDSGVFFTENRTIVEKVSSYLSGYCYSLAIGFERDWQTPKATTMARATDAVIKFLNSCSEAGCQA